MDRAQLLTQFHQTMVGIYEPARRLRPPYVPGDFLRIVTDMGGKAAADKLLAMVEPSDGFGTLLLRGKEALKLSVEYVVLQNPWRQLFEPDQLAVARRRLQDVRCELPPEDTAAPAEPEDDEEESDAATSAGSADRVVYFNNCKNRPHERLFGPEAFYDLNLTGIQAGQAVGNQVGQECVAATTAPDSRVTFTWYSFLREGRLREQGSEDRTLYRVFFGDPLLVESFSKEDAAAQANGLRGRFLEIEDKVADRFLSWLWDRARRVAARQSTDGAETRKRTCRPRVRRPKHGIC